MHLTDRLKKLNLRLAAILIAAAFLYGWNIWQAGSANSYYTAAIISMTKSWHNFWYASFDPAGFITVDKPPVALWFMAISARIFGIHGWSIVLPSVLFGIASVYLLYLMVKPYFGQRAAEISALVLTLTPIAAANARTNNMDTTLLFFLLVAGYILQKAVALGKLWLVLTSFAVIGISFNIKMLQAFMVLPAMYAFYWISSSETWKRKLRSLSLATIVLAVFTLIWPLSVDLTNSSKRPYVGSSSSNSVLELAFSYNGAQRLLGQSTGIGGRFSGMGNRQKSKSAKAKTPPKGNGKQKKKAPGGQPNMKAAAPKGNGQQNGGNNPFNVGKAGPFRVFQKELGGQISWLLSFAITSLIAVWTALNEQLKKWTRLDEKRRQLLYWSLWLIPTAGFFSVAGFFHPYYTVMMAPPIAALSGIGFAHMISLKGQNSKLKALYSIGLLITTMLQAWYVSEYSVILAVLLAFCSVCAIAAFWHFNDGQQRKFAKFCLAALLVAPGFWSLTPALAGESAAIPSAGPSLLGRNGNAGGSGNEQVDSKMLKYLEKHSRNTKYLFATMDANTAAPYIIKTQKAVMTIGGYNGTDDAITLRQFKQLVRKGQIKYFYLSGKTTNNEIVKWVKKHGRIVYGKQTTEKTGSKTQNSPFNGQNQNGNMMPKGNTQAPNGQQQPSAGGQNQGNGPSKGNSHRQPGKMPKQKGMKQPGKTNRNSFSAFGSQGVLYQLD